MLNKDRHPWLHHSSIVLPSRGGPAFGIYTPVYSSSAKTFLLIFCFQLFVGPQYAISTYDRYAPYTSYSGYTHHIPYTSGCTIVDSKLCYHTLFNAPTPSLPPHKKLSKINIVDRSKNSSRKDGISHKIGDHKHQFRRKDLGGSNLLSRIVQISFCYREDFFFFRTTVLLGGSSVKKLTELYYLTKLLCFGLCRYRLSTKSFS